MAKPVKGSINMTKKEQRWVKQGKVSTLNLFADWWNNKTTILGNKNIRIDKIDIHDFIKENTQENSATPVINNQVNKSSAGNAAFQ